MNWELAIEKNLEALRRILAMLVGLVGMTGGDGTRTLPRHLHRYVLRLLRPAEAATRRLIIIAARGLVVKLPKPRAPRPKPEPETIFVLDRVGGRIVSVPVAVPKPASTTARPKNLSLSLLDPMKRFGVRRKYAKPAAMPSIRLLGIDDNPFAQFFRRPEQAPAPAPPLPSANDPLDAGRLSRRLDAIGRALDDLPGQALRMARWQARRDARLAREREERGDESIPTLSHCGADQLTPTPNPSPQGGGGAAACGPLPSGRRLTPGGEAAKSPSPLRGGVRGGGTSCYDRATASAQKKRRFHRIEPMRPGRPPGWRRKPDHDVYQVLNEVHGLAVWARDGP